MVSLLLVVLGGALIGTAQEAPISVELTVEPDEFVVLGTGTPDSATVTIALSTGSIRGNPLDLMLALDRSSSVNLEEVQRIARAFVGHLSSEDRVAVATFADSASMALGFTSDQDRAIQAIDDLTQGTQTALGDGLMVAVDELMDDARSGALPLIVLPTDGVSHVGRDPLPEAERAGSEGIPIFAVGTSPAARRQVLSEVATVSGGAFFARFSPTDTLESIYRRMDRAVAARSILITQTLGAAIRFERATENAPSVVPGGESTQLQWRIPLLFRGERWRTRFEVNASRPGELSLIAWPSALEYTDPDGQRVVRELPSRSVQVERGREAREREEEDGDREGDGGAEDEADDRDDSTNGVLEAKLSFSPETPLRGQAVQFDASESSGDITTYEWDWTNDGTFDLETEEETALHTYGNAGEFTVRLRVTDRADRTDETTVSVEVAHGLEAAAAVAAEFSGNPTVPDWMDYYIDDGVVTEEETRDANARFAADVFIPGTHYRLTADDVTAITQLNRLSILVRDYEDVSVAQNEGYREEGDFVAEVGQAYVKQEYLTEPPRANRPPILLYDENEDGQLRLAGVRFISMEEDATLFQVTDWPDQPAAAHFEDGSSQAISSAQEVPQENDDGSPLAFWHPQLFGLSVWVGIASPDGLFSSSNPDVTQP